MKKYRKENESPDATSKYGWRYHHLGVPSSIPHPDEKYIEKYMTYVSGFETSEFGIEWMRFEKDSPIPDIVQAIPHIAFEVDDLDVAVDGTIIKHCEEQMKWNKNQAAKNLKAILPITYGCFQLALDSLSVQVLAQH